ncbi:DUF3987 domain-containing protein [Anabaena subtropica]|uniref:DUF3987 domain-containing protein n=1 Tax=Anabaena subtropica FACHB-260 TaxID=2692884 RepID=A0ABR8CLE2_9NOST|nr:DUF3987 domain-containing protein [Anabaena subtropica]MBD2343643.1 DUF3987 domain-containing protein [Anabaena subtropica FACHB-260]
MYARTGKGANAPKIDVAQIRQQLEALGYIKDDVVYIRAFYPSNDPRKANDEGRKTQTNNLDKLVKIVRRFQTQGRGVYFTVNGCGHKNDEITECRAIFFEHDNLDKEVQKELWRSLHLPEPSLQIDTGGRSIHSYWTFEQFIDPQQWKSLQADLLEYADADRSIKNPSRVMRLAGCWHFASENVVNGQTQIILNTGKRYTYKSLRELIPYHEAKLQGNPPVADDWADMRKLSQYLEGYKPGGRKNWITCKCPVHGGNSSDSLHINEHTGQFHCHKNCNTKEIFRVTLDIARSKGHIFPEKHQQAIAKPSKVLIHTTATIPYDDIKAEYINLLDSQVSKSEISRFKTEANKKYYPVKLDNFLGNVEVEHRKSEDNELIREDIQTILRCSKINLDVRQFLPRTIATALMLFGRNQSLPETSLMMCLISVVSSSHMVGTKVLIGNRHNEFYQNPAINHALVGESGTGKSIIFRALVKKPLNALIEEEVKRFKEESEEYNRDLAAWEKSDKSTPQPEAPKPVNKMYFTGSTLEGLKDYIAKAPEYSILNVVDELSGLFGGFNQYKRGQGNDRQEFLSLYDGDGFSEAKVSKNICVKASNTAWLGGLQPSILHQYFQIGASDGLLPRFTFSILNEDIRLLPDESAPVIDLTGLLQGLYRATLNCAPQTYHITDEAYQYFRSVDNKWQLEAGRLPNGALKEFLKKCKGLLGRVSLNLHLIHELSDSFCGTPPAIIPLIRVQQAAGIIEHLLKQIQTVHLQIAGESTQSAILAMIKLSIKRQSLGEEGWLTARDVSLSQNAKGRMKSAEVRELMTKAVDMGYGELRGTGKRLEFRTNKVVDDLLAADKKASTPVKQEVQKNNSQNSVDDCRRFVDNCFSPETIVKTELQKAQSNFVDDVDDFSHEMKVKTLVEPQTDTPVVNLDENLHRESSTTSTNQDFYSESIGRNSFEPVSQESTNYVHLSTISEPQLDEIPISDSFEVISPKVYKFKQGDKVSYQGSEAEVLTMMGEKLFIDLGDRSCSVSISDVNPV